MNTVADKLTKDLIFKYSSLSIVPSYNGSKFASAFFRRMLFFIWIAN